MSADQERSGVLRWLADQERLKVEFTGGSGPVKYPDRDLDQDLRDLRREDLDGVAVNFTWHKGQARDIRRTGVPVQRKASNRPVRSDAFINPYTFVPAPSRGAYTASGTGSDGLGDGEPVGHHSAAPDRWSGTIGVRLTTETPLLLLGAPTIDPVTKHATHPVLTRDGVPHLAATAVKGMLRSAFEAVTNSRFGIFVDHGARLGTRMAAEDAKGMVPARVSDDGQSLILLPGNTAPGAQSRPNPLLHAAWLPSYAPATPPPSIAPGHGDQVDARVELIQHHRWKGDAHVKDFRMWSVQAVVRAGDPIPEIEPTPARPARAGRSWHEPLGQQQVIRGGYVMHTNQNFARKHDERIFFADSQLQETKPLRQDLLQQWQEVVADYRAAHRPAEITDRRQGTARVSPDECIGRDPGKTAWSPHQYDDDWLTLKPGQLCYAHVSGGSVDGVYPVMIARRLSAAAPADLLDESLRPADKLANLSPADRVFGWTHDSGPGAYRGNLRIGPVTCVSGADAVETFTGDGLPLAILGQPKPQQAGFYTGIERNRQVVPLPDGRATTGGSKYQPDHTLRGRKVYPHHAGLSDDYWDNPTTDRTQQIVSGRYQEYRRPHASPDEQHPVTEDGTGFKLDPSKEQRDDQNRSITGWIKPAQEFTFDIEVTNLSDLELGALTWLLTLPDDAYHRLGYGKPLGFGSVHLAIDEARTHIHRGDQWQAYYRRYSADAAPLDDGADLTTLKADFEAMMLDRDTVLAAFTTAATGDRSVSVHYPRIRPERMRGEIPVPPDPRGRSFEWFAANSRNRGKHLSLPDAGGTLPIDVGEGDSGQSARRPRRT